MFIEFTVGNFRSIKEPVTFSMEAGNLTGLEESHVAPERDGTKALRSAAIFGANASGKSNIIGALGFMRNFVINSAKQTQAFERINVEPFRLNTATANRPSFFQIVFISNSTLYRYGLELDGSAVRSEWLFSKKPKAPGKEAALFTREGDRINVGPLFREGDGLEGKTRPNASFLSTVAMWNGSTAANVIKWFTDCNVVIGTQDDGYLAYTANEFQTNPEFKSKFMEYLQLADMGIDSVMVDQHQVQMTDIPVGLPAAIRDEILSQGAKTLDIKTEHKLFDHAGKRVGSVLFDLAGNESAGTQKYFSFAGPIHDTLAKGKVLFIDEFDAKLHPDLGGALVRLFNSSISNKNNAQLVFVTHNTRFLSNEVMRRDQIWFAEKNDQGATRLFSLLEYKDPSNSRIRKDASFEKNYRQGRYGSVPSVGNFERIYGHLRDDK